MSKPADQPDQLYAMRHSLAHIAATAVQHLWPDAKFGVGPVVEHGFYYDIDLGDTTITVDDFDKIETEMRKIISEDQPFECTHKSIDEAIAWAKDRKQPYKLELMNDLKREGTTSAKDITRDQLGVESDDSKVETVSFYTNGDFEDLCRGPHATSTGKVGAFKLMKVAGAYWRGDETKPQLQRLYGAAFATEEELAAHLEALEEAKARDHRKLGRELDLFTFSDMVGPGLPLFTPRGTLVRELLKRMLEQVGRKYGAQTVTIPHIAKIDLYETSGHAQKFGDELFEVTSHYKDVKFVMKPVNCPHHTQIYAAKPRSYRDLPISLMESTMQYRDEKPGEIGGLTRVRAITVDDGHIFLRADQIKEEVVKLAKWIEEFHSSLGLYGDHWVSLSLRDPAKQENYTGTKEDWDKAEAMLAEFADELGLNAKRMEGEAAIYGPKIDYMYKDVSGNERQLSTIQLDFATPGRFGLEYTDAEGKKQTPVMIHRAILGSYERFMAILLEKTAGHLPFWLAPEQVRIIQVNDGAADYVAEVASLLSGIVLDKPLKYNELRHGVDDRNESLGKKIHTAEVERVPIILIIGPKDAASRELSVRTKQGESKLPFADLENFLKEI